MISKLICFLFVLCIAGCASNVREPIVKTVSVFVDVPAEFTSPVNAPKPPVVSAYTSASEDEQERMLVESIQQHMDFIDLLLIDRSNLRNWSFKQQEIFSK